MKLDDLIIRLFETSDQNAVHQLIMDGLSEHFSELDPTLNPDLDNISANYLKMGNIFVVAELATMIIATGALIREHPGMGRIVRVSVSSDFRRMGIGQQIVHHLVGTARSMNINRIVVETNHDWPQAIAFYEHLGFCEYDRDSESVHLSLKI